MTIAENLNMKNRRLHTTIALVGAALIPPSAKAATINPTFSDLFLGFQVVTLYADDGTSLPAQGIGDGTNLIIDLGQASQFYNPSANNFSLTGLYGLSVQDLIDTYGANWNTRTDLEWGIVGTTGAGAGTTDGHAVKSTIWATVAEDTPGTISLSPRSRLPATLQNGAIGTNIAPLFVGTAPLNGASSTLNSSVSAEIGSSSQGSWSSLATANGSFGIIGGSIQGSTNSPIGTYAALDLYELQPSAKKTNGTFLGAFGLGNDGSLTFSVDPSLFAAPEPSTSVYLTLAGLLLVTGTRRQHHPAKLDV